MKIAAAIVGLVLLAGCGAREELTPAAGDRMPVAPATAPQALTTDDLLAIPPIARPKRVDEPSASEEREEDRFDLPPT